jgi:cell division protein FtsB
VSQRNKILMAVVVFAMFNLLLVVLFGDNGLVELRRLHNTHRGLIEANTALTRENLKMYRSIDRLQSDSDYVEGIARQELGMIRSNEFIFKFKSALTPR